MLEDIKNLQWKVENNGINSKITASGEIGGKKIMFTRDLSNNVLKHFAEVDIEAYLKQTYKKGDVVE